MTQTTNSIMNDTPVLLELFSGTGSVGRAFHACGWEVFSVDIDASTQATLVANVIGLQLDALPPRVDYIWASPPCTHYSCARTKAKTPRDLAGSDALVRKVLAIICYYDIPPWFMENPHSGLLKGRGVVVGLPMRVVD
jgi:site-specific DNA-cytosine methylase